jgi:hypothetical protein
MRLAWDGTELVTQRWIGQERAALFGREDEVDQNVGEGLWHGHALGAQLHWV